MDQPEPLREARNPFEVVEQAPNEIAADRVACLERSVDRDEMATQVIDSSLIVDGAVWTCRRGKFLNGVSGKTKGRSDHP